MKVQLHSARCECEYCTQDEAWRERDTDRPLEEPALTVWVAALISLLALVGAAASWWVVQ